MNRDRFVVGEVSGAAINPEISGGQGSRPVPTSYYVFDRAFAHRCVAAFDAADPHWTRAGDKGRRATAYARCAELNAWDEACLTT